MILAILYCFGSLAIWPIYQLFVRRWTRCSRYLAICFGLHLFSAGALYLLQLQARQVSQDWWMMSALYPVLNIFFGIAELLVIVVSWMKVPAA